MQHPAKSTRGIGTAAKPEDKYSIARFKSSHQELVGIGHVVGDPVAKRESNETSPRFPYTGECVSRAHCAEAGMIVGDLRGALDQCLVELDHIGILLAKLIPRTVATNDNILGHSQFELAPTSNSIRVTVNSEIDMR